MRYVCMAILLVTGALGALSINVTDGLVVAIRFSVALGALIVAAQALQTHRFVFAGLFTAIALLYNPLVQTFTITGEWQRLILLATIVAFAASLVSTRQSRLQPSQERAV